MKVNATSGQIYCLTNGEMAGAWLFLSPLRVSFNFISRAKVVEVRRVFDSSPAP
jgi:hypothetical protein